MLGGRQLWLDIREERERETERGALDDFTLRTRYFTFTRFALLVFNTGATHHPVSTVLIVIYSSLLRGSARRISVSENEGV